MRKAITLGYRSHQTSTCGLHCHVNRSCFGEPREEQDLVISKILFFVEMHWAELLKFSRRSEYSINRWAARYGYERTGRDILEKAKKAISEGMRQSMFRTIRPLNSGCSEAL